MRSGSLRIPAGGLSDVRAIIRCGTRTHHICLTRRGYDGGHWGDLREEQERAVVVDIVLVDIASGAFDPASKHFDALEMGGVVLQDLSSCSINLGLQLNNESSKIF